MATAGCTCQAQKQNCKCLKNVVIARLNASICKATKLKGMAWKSKCRNMGGNTIWKFHYDTTFKSCWSFLTRPQTLFFIKIHFNIFLPSSLFTSVSVVPTAIWMHRMHKRINWISTGNHRCLGGWNASDPPPPPNITGGERKRKELYQILIPKIEVIKNALF